VGLIAASFAPPPMRFSLLFCACFVYSAGGAFYAVDAAATVPKAVTRLTPAEGIALHAAAQSSARVVGQAMAGTLAQLLGPMAATLASLALSTSRLANALRLQSRPPHSRDAAGSFGDAWRLMWRDMRLRYLTATTLTMNFGGSIILGAFFPYAYQQLHLTPFSVGVMLFIGGVASVLAARQTRPVLARVNPLRLCVGRWVRGGRDDLDHPCGGLH
jgi:predicted MFS family arabinose efflux permease